MTKHRSSSAPHDDMSLRAKNLTVRAVAIATAEQQPGNFWSALQTTPQGYAWMEGHRDIEGDGGLVRIWFVWQGREYMRNYERFYGPTWAARLATEFARDVVEGRVGE